LVKIRPINREREKMSDEEKLKRARKTVRAKLGFIRHFTVYVLVLAGLAILNNVTGGGYQWWLWVAFGWGIGVVSHFLSAFVFRNGALEDRLVQEELKRMDEGR
jgi:hypothetical protein